MERRKVAVSEKTPHIIYFDLYSTLNTFVERFMAREVRCRVTDRRTD